MHIRVLFSCFLSFYSFCVLHSMHPDPAHLPSSLFHPLPLQSPPPKIKQNLRGRKKKGKNLIMEATVRHSESRKKPFIYTCLHAGLHGKESLTGALTGTSWAFCFCRVPWSWRSRNPLSAGLPHPTPMLQQVTDGVDFGGSQHITMVLDLGSCSVGQPGSWK